MILLLNAIIRNKKTLINLNLYLIFKNSNNYLK